MTAKKEKKESISARGGAEVEVATEGQYICPNCGKLDRIQEKYLDPIIETRKWNGEEYELIDINFEDTDYITVCPKCGAVLDEENGWAGQKEEMKKKEWVVVKAFQGCISEVRVFDSASKAYAGYAELMRDYNEEEDDVEIYEVVVE